MVKTKIVAASYDIEVIRPAAQVLITKAEFMDVLNTATKYVEQIRPLRKNQKNLDNAQDIIKEMKFVAMFSYRFRQETYDKLNQLLDELYVEIYYEMEKAS